MDGAGGKRGDEGGASPDKKDKKHKHKEKNIKKESKRKDSLVVTINPLLLAAPTPTTTKHQRRLSGSHNSPKAGGQDLLNPNTLAVKEKRRGGSSIIPERNVMHHSREKDEKRSEIKKNDKEKEEESSDDDFLASSNPYLEFDVEKSRAERKEREAQGLLVKSEVFAATMHTKALKDFMAADASEISFREGDRIKISKIDESGWAEGTLILLGGGVGWLPCMTYVKTPKKIMNENDSNSSIERREKALNKFFSCPVLPPVSEEPNQEECEPSKVSPSLVSIGKMLRHLPGPHNPKKSKTALFGKSITEVLSLEGHIWKVPLPVYQTVEHLRENSLETEGLFRVNGNMSHIEEVRALYTTKLEMPDFSSLQSHTIAGILKRYLRDLPDPVIPVELYDALESAAAIEGVTARNLRIDEIMSKLSEERQTLLDYLFEFLHRLAENESVTLMNASNLGLLFSQILFRRPNQPPPSMSTISKVSWGNIVVSLCIQKGRLMLSKKD